ncbi:MAG TPA: YlmC/YmxH family sporulation protein [Firmicutes bacterium]|nr:YlmC/YmxH family sporulation protein [Bacillota bacterium]
MRYSDLAGKEIVCFDEGIRLGVVNDTDLIINTKTGVIDSIIIPYGKSWFHKRMIVIPWHGIKKIGRDLIIVDLTKAQDYEDIVRRLDLE